MDNLAGQPFDLVVTVCDQALFPGDTEVIHLSFPDPEYLESYGWQPLDG